MTTNIHGHINHLYEDRDITFRKIKDIIIRVGQGRMVETYEKYDGINMFITWDFNLNELRVARNKGHIKEGGLDLYGLELKFGNRPPLMEAFQGAYTALSQALGSLPPQVMSEMFGSTGGVWYSTEVIDPNVPNTIHYDNHNIIFHRHGPRLFDFVGNPLETNLTRNVEVLQANGDALNEALEGSDWRIQTPRTIIVKPVDESFITNACLMLDGICKQSGVGVHESLRTYTFKRLTDDFQRYPLINPILREAVAKNLAGVPGAYSLTKITSGLDRTLKEQINQMTTSGKNTITKLMKPIEEVVHQFGTIVMNGMHSAFIQDPQAEVARLREQVRNCIDEINNGTDEKGKKIVEQNMWKLKHVDTINSSMEGIVFMEGSRLYKLTGAFAPVNQICAYVKYREPPKANHQSLASFITAG